MTRQPHSTTRLETILSAALILALVVGAMKITGFI